MKREGFKALKKVSLLSINNSKLWIENHQPKCINNKITIMSTTYLHGNITMLSQAHEVLTESVLIPQNASKGEYPEYKLIIK